MSKGVGALCNLCSSTDIHVVSMIQESTYMCAFHLIINTSYYDL